MARIVLIFQTIVSEESETGAWKRFSQLWTSHVKIIILSSEFTLSKSSFTPMASVVLICQNIVCKESESGAWRRFSQFWTSHVKIIGLARHQRPGTRHQA